MAPPNLISNHYAAPTCHIGDWLDDEIHGLVQVGGWTDTPVPWPRRKKAGTHSPILCGDLIQAVRIESSEAIQYYWGVGAVTVWKWRQALKVDRTTDGTRRLLQERTGVPPEAAGRGRKKASTPEARAKMAETKRGQPIHQATKEALAEAAKLPRTKFGSPAAYSRWSEAETRFLKKWQSRLEYAEIAKYLHRSRSAVEMRAVVLGLPSKVAPMWSGEDDLTLIKMWDDGYPIEDISKALGRTVDATYLRRTSLGIQERNKRTKHKDKRI